MIFWIFVVMFIIGVLWLAIDDFSVAALLLCVIGGFIAGAMLFVIVVSNTNVEGQIRQNEMIYESLKYQYETGMYENDNDIGKKELMNQIEEWNSDLAFGQSAHDDFWVGIFFPNIYDGFEFIELEEGSHGKA